MKQATHSFLSVFLALVLIAVLVFPLSFGTEITAQAALDTAELQQIVNSIPDRSQWSIYYVDSSTLGPAYDNAKQILASPNNYQQKDVTVAVANLKLVLNTIQYHTRGLAVSPRETSCPVGGIVTLTVAIEPTNGADPVTWVSNRPDIADVSPSGWVLVKKYITEPVLISAVSNGTSSTCVVHITPAEGPSTHVHVYDKEVKDAKYLKTVGTCITDAVYYKSCSCGQSASGESNAAYLTFEGDRDPKKHAGEIDVYKAEVPATCTSKGQTAIGTCKACGKLAGGEDIPMLPHTQKTAANCVNKAICSVCGQSYGELDHNNHIGIVQMESKPATCFENGYLNRTYCSACKAVFEQGSVLPAAHSWGNWKYFRSDDPNEQGIEVRFCSVCGVYELREAKPQPQETTDKPSDEQQPEKDLNFFQRIVEWFRNLFVKLFGKKKN